MKNRNKQFSSISVITQITQLTQNILKRDENILLVEFQKNIIKTS